MKNTTKCANLHAICDLRVEEKEIPALLDDEVLLEVKACGICGSDLPRVYTKGTYHRLNAYSRMFMKLYLQVLVLLNS
mgnify:CR=1 FL=1